MEAVFCSKIFTKVLSIKIVTNKSRGRANKRAMSLFLGSGLAPKALSLIEGSENRADSEAEKNPEQKIKKRRMSMPMLTDVVA